MSSFRHIAELVDISAPIIVNLKNGDTAEKQTAIFDDTEQRDGNTYVNQIAVTFFGKNREVLATAAVGRRYKVTFRAKSRQYNGRWYTDLDGYGFVEVDAKGEPITASSLREAEAAMAPPAPPAADDDDLPF